MKLYEVSWPQVVALGTCIAGIVIALVFVPTERLEVLIPLVGSLFGAGASAMLPPAFTRKDDK